MAVSKKGLAALGLGAGATAYLGYLTAGSAAQTVESALNSSNYTTSNEAGKTYINTQPVIFPADLVDTNSSKVAFMAFNFYQYTRPSVFETVIAQPQGTVILPLPTGLVDSQSLNYEEASLSPGVGAALDAMAQNYYGSKQQGFAEAAASALNAGTQGAAVGVSATAVDEAEKLLKNVTTQKFLQVGGLTVNPFMTVLFNSPTFKRHTFTWKFIPKNAMEADTLKFIINKFRYHSLPDLSASTAGTLLKYPDLVRPVISPAGYTYSFKYCVISDSSANFAPGATPSFTRTSLSPSAVEFTVRLLEIEYFIKPNLLTNDPNYTIPSDVNFANNLATSVNSPQVIPPINNVTPAPVVANGVVSGTDGSLTTSLQLAPLQ